uniref:Uncharacterized protein AlNc14C86G5489 n=1 Tax=Albugo laibachii Nc14 TaxID=890382 RepID=F0WFV4_9STRA|nr:conserved hypothetical protein [Albugo laibachii Nc14]|eukprot:CCA20088.1 conserved hypothetical protein [Albugo laibachii Nc14]
MRAPKFKRQHAVKEPVAPWRRDDIPDYGPLKERQLVTIFTFVGIFATFVYESTDYFNQIDRWLAYTAIWLPLWLRLLAHFKPKEADNYILKEDTTASFQSELQEVAQVIEEEED